MPNRNFDMHQLTPQRLGQELRNILIGGWYFSGDDGSRNRGLLLGFALNNNVVANLVGGNYLTGLLLLMNADDSFIGIIGMIPFLSNIVQLFAPIVLERFPQRQKILTLARFIALMINAAFISVIPFLPFGDTAKLTIVAFAIALVNATHAFINPGFTVWHYQFLPSNVRSSYFSTQNIAVTVLVAAVTMGASKMVDIFSAAGNEITGILILRGLATVLIFLDALFLLKMKEYPYEKASERLKIKDVFVLPLKNKIYMCTIAVGVLWSFTANMPSSFYSVYMLKNLDVGYTYLTAMGLINIPCMIIFTPLWRKLIVRWNSWLKVTAVAILGYPLHYLMLALCTSSNYLWLYPLALLEIYPCSAGVSIGLATISYMNIPPQNATVYNAFYSVACNLAAFVAVAISRSLMNNTKGVVIKILGTDMINKQFYLLIVGVLMIVTAACIYLLMRYLRRNKYEN